MSARKGFYRDTRDLRDQMDDVYQFRGRGVGASWFVDSFRGDDSNNDGQSWGSPFATMAKALTECATLDTIYFRGDIREEIAGSNLKFDISIIGCGSLHHPDQPTSAYDPGAACWRPPASPTATTPLLKLRGRGWSFHNILFDCPVDAAAIKMERNGLGDVSEYDPSHARFINCDFRNGLYGIEDNGGAFNVLVQECVFETLDATASAAGIISTSTAVASPRRWRILNNFFQPDSSTEGNERHIVSPLNGSLLRDNVFGTVKGTGRYVDLNGGTGNVVARNVMAGNYATDDYRSGTGDVWYQNPCKVTATTAPDGVSILVPAA